MVRSTRKSRLRDCSGRLALARNACIPFVSSARVASVQRKLPGTDIETADIKGWAWPELDLVETSAGAPRAQRDALKLLASLIQHTDSKPEQQRLICLPK